MRNSRLIDTLITIIITIIALALGQVTVFYIIYLFWFQELIRTIVDLFFSFDSKFKARFDNTFQSLVGSFFLLFIYFIFIVVLFGALVIGNNPQLLIINIKVFFFKDIYFNINIVLFAIYYILYRIKNLNTNFSLQIFNKRHLILHISIVLGGVLQFLVIKNFQIDSTIGSGLVILPFLILKIILNKH